MEISACRQTEMPSEVVVACAWTERPRVEEALLAEDQVYQAERSNHETCNKAAATNKQINNVLRPTRN